MQWFGSAWRAGTRRALAVAVMAASLGATAGVAQADTVTFNDFSDVSPLTLNGSAAQSGTNLSLTTPARNLAGSAWVTKPQPTGSFSTHFRVFLGNKLFSKYADGMTFAIQGAGPTALGRLGGDLGLAPVSPIAAVVLDTFTCSQPVLGFTTNQFVMDGCNAQLAKSSPGGFPLNTPFTVWVDYDAPTKVLQVFLALSDTDKPATPVLTTSVDLRAVVGPKAYFGFTAGTGSDAQDQLVQNWSLQTHIIDDDSDGVDNADDNCPAIANSDQADLDGDHVGDVCDSDIDGDGANNDVDAFPRDPAEQADTDGDGVGDHADAFPNDPAESRDSDGDGVGDHGDNCPSTSNPDQADRDGDGAGDACDPPTAKLTVTNTAVPAGNVVTYAIVVTNSGPGVAHDVVLDDKLPAAIVPYGAIPGCQTTGQDITCKLGDMGKNGFRVIAVVARVKPGAPATPQTATATASSPDAADASATATVTP